MTNHDYKLGIIRYAENYDMYFKTMLEEKGFEYELVTEFNYSVLMSPVISFKNSQEKVDKIFLAAASDANKARIPLAKMAVEETGMGVVEDKVIKNNYASEYIYNAYEDTKTCGVVEPSPVLFAVAHNT